MFSFEINQQAGKKINKNLVKDTIKRSLRALKKKGNIDISIAIVGDQTIRKLNKKYRKKDRVTDVLSFQYPKDKFYPETPMGEIIICYPQAAKQAQVNRHSLEKELSVLLTHGLLHLLGYGHKTRKEAEEMEALEKKIVK